MSLQLGAKPLLVVTPFDPPVLWGSVKPGAVGVAVSQRQAATTVQLHRVLSHWNHLHYHAQLVPHLQSDTSSCTQTGTHRQLGEHSDFTCWATLHASLALCYGSLPLCFTKQFSIASLSDNVAGAPGHHLATVFLLLAVRVTYPPLLGVC